MAALALVVASSAACTTREQLGPPGANMTGAVTSSSSAGAESGTDETGAPSDMSEGSCDPLADPLDECGPNLACDLTTEICVPAPGAGQPDAPCVETVECEAGLVCDQGRCRKLCALETGDGCEADEVCIAAAAPIPGLCAQPCELALDLCSVPGDACKRAIGSGGAVLAACVPNPGFGLTGDPCVADVACAPGLLCTPATTHTLPCVDGAAQCCAPVCDVDELPCFGLEPICYTLMLPGQPGAGFCGAE